MDIICHMCGNCHVRRFCFVYSKIGGKVFISFKDGFVSSGHWQRLCALLFAVVAEIGTFNLSHC